MQKINLHPLCQVCSDEKCMGVTRVQAWQKLGCKTLFWLTVEEIDFDKAVELKRRQGARP